MRGVCRKRPAFLFPFSHYDGGEEACQEDDGGAEHDGEVGMQMQTRETP